MENEMFLHILMNLYMILYRFFCVIVQYHPWNKIYNLINAHEVQTVSLKKMMVRTENYVKKYGDLITSCWKHMNYNASCQQMIIMKDWDELHESVNWKSEEFSLILFLLLYTSS